MPIYAFRCTQCRAEQEVLAALGDTAPRDCATCGAVSTCRQRFTRVAVRYTGWGFTATDSLVGDTRGKDFRSLRENAERISDES